ncbi:MAG: GNAT family N-acetyltransferase [Lachnospiraceae bacterium]|nr:GNAT family N-acetyltransferase [Lachnospiraceae bacterium]
MSRKQEPAVRLTGIGEENRGAFAHLLPEGLSSETVEMGAIADGKAAGTAAFYAEGGILVLDWLYVRQDLRRKGIGSAILSGILDVVRECGAIALQCTFTDDNSELDGFLAARGAVFADEGEFYRIPVSDFLKSDVFKKFVNKEPDPGTVSLASLSDMQLRAVKNAFVNHGQNADMLEAGAYDPETSFVMTGAAGEELRAVLLTQRKDDLLYIHFLANFTSHPTAMMDLLRALKDALPADEELTLVFTGDEHIRALAQKLCGRQVAAAGSYRSARIEAV